MMNIKTTVKVDPTKLASAAGAATDLLKALANRHRLLILCQLIDRECSVGGLAGALQLRQSTVSQHLALLRKDGVVAARRDGQTIWYSIAADAAREVIEALYRAYCYADGAGRRRKSTQLARP